MAPSELQSQLSPLSSPSSCSGLDQAQDQEIHPNSELRRQHLLESMAKLEGNTPTNQPSSSTPLPVQNTFHSHHHQPYHSYSLPVTLLPHQQAYHHHTLLHPTPYVHYQVPRQSLPFLPSSSTNRFTPVTPFNPTQPSRPHQLQPNHHQPQLKSAGLSGSTHSRSIPQTPHKSHPSILISPETSPDSALRTTLHSLKHSTTSKITTSGTTPHPPRIQMIPNHAQLYHHNIPASYYHHPQQARLDYHSRAQAGGRSIDRRSDARLSSSSSSSSTGLNRVRSAIEDKRLPKPAKVLKFFEVLPPHPPSHPHHHHSSPSVVPSHRASVVSASTTTSTSSSSTHDHHKKLSKKDRFSWFDY